MVEGYSRSQIWLHWATFGLVALQFLFSDAISEAFGRAMKGEAVAPSLLLGQHILGGVLIAALTAWRLRLRMMRGAPEVPEGTDFEVKLAKGTHHALYALLILAPLAGALAWFAEIGPAAGLHGLFTTLMMLAVVLHVAGALKQQFVKKNNILDRMRSPR